MVGWFEIPVENMERAVKFYQEVFSVELTFAEFGPELMAWFPMDNNLPGAPGALVKNDEAYTPSAKGVLIYFSAMSGDLNVELNRIEEAGGNVLMPKTLITEEIGYMALFLDTEGNRIALHSIK